MVKESLINSATHLRTSALSSRRRQILDVALLRLRFVSSIDTAHLCKSGRLHFISVSLESHAHAQAVNAPRHAEVRIIGIEQVRDARIDRSIYPSSFIPLPPFAKVNGVHP